MIDAQQSQHLYFIPSRPLFLSKEVIDRLGRSFLKVITFQESPDKKGEPWYDEAMANAERDLAEDAEWKRIQENTFTRYRVILKVGLLNL